MSELSENINICIAEILKQLTALGERPETTAKLSQAKSALDLVNQIAAWMDLTPSVATFTLKLLELSNKQKGVFTRVEQRYFVNTVEFVSSRTKQSAAAASSNLAFSGGNIGMSPAAATALLGSLKVLVN